MLTRARQTGEGGWLDASLAEGFSLLPSVLVGDLLAGAQPRARGATEFDGRPFYRVYRLADGMVAVAAVEPQFWAELCSALGLDDLTDAQFDDARKDAVIARLTTRFAGLNKTGLTTLLEGRDTCTNVVNTYEEMFSSDHTRERDLIRAAVDVPMRVLAPPFRIDGARPPETMGAPTQGQHTREVLAELGLTREAIDSLFASGGGRLPGENVNSAWAGRWPWLPELAAGWTARSPSVQRPTRSTWRWWSGTPERCPRLPLSWPMTAAPLSEAMGSSSRG